MSTAGTLIVGAGQAGIELAAALRSAGDERPITILGAEHHAPYQRPPLSKGFLSEDASEKDLWLRNGEWFAQRSITVLTGNRAEHLEWHSDGTGIATTSSGVSLEFSSLALATGASPRRLQVPGAELGGIHYLRNIQDARDIAASLGKATRLVVVGGGFIGLEVAATARAAGCNVTVIEAAERIIGRAVCPETSAFYRGAHERRGTVVHTGATITEMPGVGDSVRAVKIIDETGREWEIEADVVLIGIGVLPETALAEQLGLAVENGIAVDARMWASDSRTVALGDVASMPLPGGPRGDIRRARLESVPNALEQARVAAASLLGREESYEAVPWFWSDQGELKLQIAGLSHGYDQVVVRGEPETEKFSVMYFRDGGIIAADCINSPREFMAIKTALRDGVRLAPETVADASVSLRDVVRARMLKVA